MTKENDAGGRKLSWTTTTFVVIVSIILGLLLQPNIQRKYPFFHWMPYLYKPFIGFIPATQYESSYGFTFEQLRQTNLRNQVALVTGANSGIGKQIALNLSRQGAKVIMACRSPQRCFKAADEIRSDERYSGAPLVPLIMDVSSLTSVQSAARMVLHQLNGGKLDMLFLNAGIFSARGRMASSSSSFPVTEKDGIETVFATNVVGHHLLYRLLEPALLVTSSESSPAARVVSTSSVAGEIFFDANKMPSTLPELNSGRPSKLKDFEIYGRSKLAQVAWTKALLRHRRSLIYPPGDEDENNNSTKLPRIYANSAHPGVVFTDIIGKATVIPRRIFDLSLWLQKRILWSAEEGALTELFLGVAPHTEELRRKNYQGKYFHPQSMEYDHPSNDDNLDIQDKVWNLCEELVKEYLS